MSLNYRVHLWNLVCYQDCTFHTALTPLRGSAPSFQASPLMLLLHGHIMHSSLRDYATLRKRFPHIWNPLSSVPKKPPPPPLL